MGLQARRTRGLSWGLWPVSLRWTRRSETGFVRHALAEHPDCGGAVSQSYGPEPSDSGNRSCLVVPILSMPEMPAHRPLPPRGRLTGGNWKFCRASYSDWFITIYIVYYYYYYYYCYCYCYILIYLLLLFLSYYIFMVRIYCIFIIYVYNIRRSTTCERRWACRTILRWRSWMPVASKSFSLMVFAEWGRDRTPAQLDGSSYVIKNHRLYTCSLFLWIYVV